MGTNDFDWQSFLRQWSASLLASPLAEGLPDSVRQSGWLGLPPASEEQIAEAERRLKIPLPPSYKSFLRVTNGWRRPTRSIELLRGADQIDWFRKAHKDWVKAYSISATIDPGEVPAAEYFAYGDHASDFKSTHLKETLQISEVGDAAVYLLNPQIISKDGEWEAWFLANWLPGVRRYRSFREMMQSEYHEFAGADWKAPVGVVGEMPDEYVGSPGSPKRRVKKRRKPAEPKILNRALSKWTADELLSYLDNPEFDIIHDECIYGLGLFADPRAIEPLFIQLFRGRISAAGPLKQLAPERLREALLKILGDWKNNPGIVHNIARMLAEFGEDRAVPLLVEMMKNEHPDLLFLTNYVGRSIADFADSGFRALAEHAQDASQMIRLRAAIGLCDTNRSEAREIFKKLASDRDPQIRHVAQVALQVLPPKRV